LRLFLSQNTKQIILKSSEKLSVSPLKGAINLKVVFYFAFVYDKL